MKCTVVGDSGVGKTALLRSYILPSQPFERAYIPTYIEKYSAKLNRKGKQLSLEFWDTGGQMDSPPIMKTFEKTDCFLLCFSVASKPSFDNLEKWIKELQKVQPTASIYIIGCKTDLRDDKSFLSKLTSNQKNEQFISMKQGQDFVRKYNLVGYLECSSLSRKGNQEVFDDAITTILLRDAYFDEDDKEGDGSPKSSEDFPSSNASQVDTSSQVPKLFDSSKSLTSLQESQQSTPKPSTEQNGGSSQVPPKPELPTVAVLLKDPKLPLERLFADESRTEALREFRLRNKSLITFLAKTENMTKLVELISSSTEHVIQMSAAEFLSADIPAIIDSFCSEQKPQWPELFSFLQKNKPPLRVHQLSMNFARVANFMIKNRNVEFMLFLKENSYVLELLVNHIAADCIVGLLITILECQLALVSLGIPLQIPVTLPNLIGKKLKDPQISEDVLFGIKEFFEILSVKFNNPTLLETFQDISIIEPLIARSLKNESLEFMHILTKMISLCKNTGEYENMQLPLVLSELVKLNEDGNQEKPLQVLYKALYQPCSDLPPSITTTNAILSPLGLFRLKSVQLILALVKCNFLLVDNALIEYKIISRCIDLFFQFRWNNILHGIVEKIALHLLETKPSYLCLHLLRDCKLLERIMQAQQNEEQEKTMRSDTERRIPRQGYMGHLYNIAVAIIKSAKVHSAVFYLLEDVPNRGWRKFEEKLKQLTKVVETNYTGYPPTMRVEHRRDDFQLSAND